MRQGIRRNGYVAHEAHCLHCRGYSNSWMMRPSSFQHLLLLRQFPALHSIAYCCCMRLREGTQEMFKALLALLLACE